MTFPGHCAATVAGAHNCGAIFIAFLLSRLIVSIFETQLKDAQDCSANAGTKQIHKDLQMKASTKKISLQLLIVALLSAPIISPVACWALEPTQRTVWYFGKPPVSPLPVKRAPLNAPTGKQIVYPITEAGIAQALNDARNYLAANSDTELTLLFPPGTFNLDDSGTGKGIFDVSKINPTNGRLIIQGAGSNYTNLIFKGLTNNITGLGAAHVTFQGIHMGREKLTVSQGLVQEITPTGNLLLSIEDGFPTPEEIKSPIQGNYLRRYENKLPHAIISENNAQVPFKSAHQVAGRVWEFEIGHPGYLRNYAKGDLVGIKSVHGAQAYYFAYSSGIIFNDLLWTEESRGVFRLGSNNISVLNCRINKRTAEQCLATDSGGVQIGQPKDAPTSNNLVHGCDFHHTGDDSVAFFNGDSTNTVSDCFIGNSFARGILLYKSDNVSLVNDRVVNCPILK